MIGLGGNVEATIKDLHGRVLERHSANNLVTTRGLQLARDLFGGIGARPDNIRVGTGTSATTAGMTALESEVLEKIIDRRLPGTATISYEVLLESTDANGYALSEIGLFESDYLIGRALFSPTLNKTSSVTIAVVYHLYFANA